VSKSGLKILIVSQYFWPEDFRINDLAHGLVRQGHIVEVLTGMPNYPGGKLFPGYRFTRPHQEVFRGVTVKRVPLIPRAKGRGRNLLLNYLSFALSASILGPLRCKNAYDVIFVFEPSPVTVGLPAIVLKKVFRIPILFWVQDLWPESLSATGAITSKPLLNLVSIFVRFLYRQCDRILIQSQAFKGPIQSLGVSAGRITYYPNSAEALYRPETIDAAAPERSQIPGGFIIMFAGNIGEAQDFPTILKAAESLKMHPDIHFVILGDGRKYAWLESQVAKRDLGTTVHLLGRHSVASMPRFFSLADVLLVSLRKDPIFELTIPSKVQSYMACGRPILAALDGEGARVISATGSGVACGAENPHGLAKSILELYNMTANQREQMGIKAREYLNANFERTLLIERLENMMGKLSGGN